MPVHPCLLPPSRPSQGRSTLPNLKNSIIVSSSQPPDPHPPEVAVSMVPKAGVTASLYALLLPGLPGRSYLTLVSFILRTETHVEIHRGADRTFCQRHPQGMGRIRVPYVVSFCRCYILYGKSSVQLCTVHENSFLHTKAAAWAKPSRSQAVSDGFGLARGWRKPKPRLPGQNSTTGESLDRYLAAVEKRRSIGLSATQILRLDLILRRHGRFPRVRDPDYEKIRNNTLLIKLWEEGQVVKIQLSRLWKNGSFSCYIGP